MSGSGSLWADTVEHLMQAARAHRGSGVRPVNQAGHLLCGAFYGTEVWPEPNAAPLAKRAGGFQPLVSTLPRVAGDQFLHHGRGKKGYDKKDQCTDDDYERNRRYDTPHDQWMLQIDFHTIDPCLLLLACASLA